MPTVPTTAPDKYREVKYLGGRILQSRELQFMQDLEGDIPAKGKFGIGAIFESGTTLNVNVAISGGLVTLSRADSSQEMLVFIEGAFEAFTAAPITFSVRPSGSQDKIYLNHVLWRVTSDGHDSTLADSTLVDSVTAEPTAEMGQLQVYVGADDHGTVQATMLARNTVAIPMFTFEWKADGTLTLADQAGPRDQILASPQRAGMVTVSAGSRVASDDDARLSNARVPIDGSVTSAKVEATAPVGATFPVAFTDETGSTAPLPINKSTGGVDATKLLFSTWNATVSASLLLIWTTITRAFAVLKSFGDRIAILETATPVDLSAHIGHNLGSSATHPAVSDVGFTANDSALRVYSNGQHANVGLIDADGNYKLPNPSYASQVRTAAGAVLDNFLSVAAAVVGLLDAGSATVPSVLSGDVSGGAASTLIGKLKGKSVAGLPGAAEAPGSTEMVVFNPSSNQYELATIPSGGGSGGTLGGDVTGSAAACTVARLRGKPISSTAPSTGQTLAWDGAQWAPAAAGGAPTLGSVRSGGDNNPMFWTILQFGKTRVAWGYGQMKGGVTIVPPTSDWNSAVMRGSFGYGTIMNAAFSVINTFNINFLHCQMGGAGQVIVDAAGPDAAAAIAGAYVTVSCVTTGQDA